MEQRKIDDLTTEEKLLAMSEFGELLKNFTELRDTVSKIVYEFWNRYKSEGDLERMYLDACSKHVKGYQKNEHNYVYFFRNRYNGLIKIGQTTDIVKRFNDIKSICKNYIGMEDALIIEGVIDTSFIKAQRVEKFFHNRYSKYRKFGEWFELPDDVWKDLFETFIGDGEFQDMVSEEDVEKLGLENKLRNIMYVGHPLDKEFNDLLYENDKLVCLSDETIELYIDKITQLISGIEFNLPYLNEDEPFYRVLYMELGDRFQRTKYDLSWYTYEHMKKYYDALASV